MSVQTNPYVEKVARDIDQLLAAGDTHPDMWEIMVEAFVRNGYAPEVVAASFRAVDGERG